jgi:hypothetical protein
VQRQAVRLLLDLDRRDLVLRHRDDLAVTVRHEVLGDDAEPRPDDAPGPAIDAPGPEQVPVWTEADAVPGIAALLEDAADAVAVEQALGWLATADRPGEALAVLRRRARARLGTGSHLAAALVLSATDPDHPAVVDTPELPVLAARAGEVVDVLAGLASRRPLLAPPTDRAGWVDPGVLVDRLLASEAPVPGCDLVQALLRLGGDGRDAALARLRAATVPVTLREAAAVVGYALGADEAPQISTPAWWAAAGCVRSTPAAHPVPAALREPGVGRPPVLRVDWSSTSSRVDGRTWTWWWPSTVPDQPAPLTADHPLAIPVRTDRISDALPTPVEITALALVHPPSTVPLTAVAVAVLNQAAQTATPVGEDLVLDALAAHPGRWDAVTAQVVGLGLSAVRLEVRARAVEVVAAAVPTRLSLPDLVAGLAGCADACVPTRWAAALTDLAGISARAGATVVALLTGLLPRLDRTRRGVGSLVGVLLDESLRAGTPATDPALREWLGGFRGSSVAARAARALLATAEV